MYVSVSADRDLMHMTEVNGSLLQPQNGDVDWFDTLPVKVHTTLHKMEMEW